MGKSTCSVYNRLRFMIFMSRILLLDALENSHKSSLVSEILSQMHLAQSAKRKVIKRLMSATTKKKYINIFIEY